MNGFRYRCCENCSNNPKNNRFASGFCNCALPDMENEGYYTADDDIPSNMIITPVTQSRYIMTTTTDGTDMTISNKSYKYSGIKIDGNTIAYGTEISIPDETLNCDYIWLGNGDNFNTNWIQVKKDTVVELENVND